MKNIVLSFLILANANFALGQIDTVDIEVEYFAPATICDEKISYVGAPYQFAWAVIEDIAKIQIESIQGKDIVFEMFISFDPSDEKEENDTIFFKYVTSSPISICSYTGNGSPLTLWTDDMVGGDVFLEKYNLTTAIEDIKAYLSHLKYYASPSGKFKDMNCSHEGTYMQCVCPSFFKGK